MDRHTRGQRIGQLAAVGLDKIQKQHAETPSRSTNESRGRYIGEQAAKGLELQISEEAKKILFGWEQM